MSNPKLDLYNINAYTKFAENQLIFTQVIVGKQKISDVLGADNTIKNWRNLPIGNPKPDLHNINAHIKFGENPLTFTRYCPDQRETIITLHYWVARYNKKHILKSSSAEILPSMLSVNALAQIVNFQSCLHIQSDLVLCFTIIFYSIL